MPRALVINPNTSVAMSDGIRETAARVFPAPWACQVVNAPAGPESLESWRDYQLAGAAVLPLVGRQPAPDGVVLACFGDPGLYALKEITPVPVVGIAEASISTALLVGGKFGILAAMTRAAPLMDAMVRAYGVEARYAGTVPLGMRVLDFEADPDATLDALVQAAGALAARGADVMLLGCAGLTGFTAALTQRVPLTIIDPVEAGCRMLKALVESGLNTSHMGLYSAPAAQSMHSLERAFSPEMVDYLKTWEAH
jgi:allantoin racemase